MILRECLWMYEGQKVRIGAFSAFLYFGVVDDELFRAIKKIDPGCMTKSVTSVYKSQLNDDICIIYESPIHGRFWFEHEFLKAKENGNLFNQKAEVRTRVKRPKTLTYQQKKKLSEIGYDPSEYRYLMEDEGAEGFIKVFKDSNGKMSYSDDSIVWISKEEF